MNLAAYCRVSTDKSDQLNSLETQKTFFEQFCITHNHHLIRIYADEGISGTKIRNRKEFLRLMSDADKGIFDAVAVKDISRLARNTVDFLTSIRQLKSYNIDTLFLNSNMTVLGDSEFVLTIFGALAQEESANTSKRVKFGKRVNAEKGRVPNLVYGYDKISGDYFNLSINEKEAEIVRQIYKWYTEEGFGALKIANMLNDKGVQTKRGAKWSQNAVSRILKNNIYTGMIINGKQEVQDFLTGQRIKKDQMDWFYHEKPEIRIVETAQFQKAQEILSQRHQNYKIQRERQSNQYLFSTLIKCSQCGYSFKRVQKTYVNTYTRWVCSQRNGYGAKSCCNRTAVEEHNLVHAIDEIFLKAVKDRKKILEQVKKQLVKHYWGQEKTIKEELQGKIEKLTRKRKKYIELYAENLIQKQELEQNLTALDNALDSLASDLKEARQVLEKTNDWESLVDGYIQHFDQLCSVAHFTNQELKTVIDKITVSPDGTVDLYIKKQDGALG